MLRGAEAGAWAFSTLGLTPRGSASANKGEGGRQKNVNGCWAAGSSRSRIMIYPRKHGRSTRAAPPLASAKQHRAGTHGSLSGPNAPKTKRTQPQEEGGNERTSARPQHNLILMPGSHLV